MATERLRVLITNDDGYQARGIRALAPAVAALGHDVLVVAPLDDQSGVGSARAGFVGRPVETAAEDVDGVTYTGIGGTPALAVTLAMVGAFGRPPDVTLSGINHGHNIGVPIFHSGTVAAALTSAAQGVSGLAISIDSEDPQHLATAAEAAAELIDWLAGQPAGTALTMNVPDRPRHELAGVRRAELAPITRSRLAGATTESGEPVITLEPADTPPDPTTDEALLAAGYVTITEIVGVQATPDDAAAKYLDTRFP